MCEGEVLVIRPISSARVRRVIYDLTSGKLKGRRKCWKIKMKKRRKVKLMKRSRKSERTLNSYMRHGDDHGMEWDANANILSQCAMCKGWVWQQQNRDWLRRLQHYAHAHVFPKCFKSLHTLLGFVLCFVSTIVFLSLWSSTQSVSQILAYFTSRKRVFWGVVLAKCATSEDTQDSTWSWLDWTQSTMLSCVANMTILPEFVCVMNVWSQCCQSSVACPSPLSDWPWKFVDRPQNVWSTNSCQVQAFQDNLRPNFW